MKIVKILSRKDLSNYVPDTNCIIISITSLDGGFVDIQPNYYIKAIYQTKFDDVEFDENGCIEDSQAKKIASFIKEYYPKVNCIICQCDAGVSRSAGLAKAICEYYKLPFPEEVIYDSNLHGIVPKYVPNLTVYKKVLYFLNNDEDSYEK